MLYLAAATPFTCTYTIAVNFLKLSTDKAVGVKASAVRWKSELIPTLVKRPAGQYLELRVMATLALLLLTGKAVKGEW